MEAQITAYYRQAASAAHPDRTGDDGARMAAVNNAYEQAQRALGFA